MGTCIGIDIGLSSVKIAEVTKGADGSLHLTKAAIRYGSFEVDTTLEKRNQELALFIKKSREALKISKQRSVVVVLPSSSVFLRYVDMLSSKHKKDHELISLEARQQIPLPLEEVAWDYRFVEAQGKNKRALLVAVKKESMHETAKMLSPAGMSSKYITLRLFGLQHMVSRLSAFRNSEGVMIVDIGAETTGVLISCGHHMWMRNISWGSILLTQEIAQQAHISFAEAEKIKKEGQGAAKDLSATAQAAIQDTIRYSLENLAAELDRSWTFYKQEYVKTVRESSEEHFSTYKIALTGGGSRLEGLRQFIEQKMRLPVISVNPLNLVKANKNALRKNHFDGVTCTGDMCESIAPLLAGAIGAALCGLEKPQYRINFLRQELTKRVSVQWAHAIRAASYMLFFAAFGVHFYFQNAELKKNYALLETAQTVAESMDTLGPQLDTITNESVALQRDGALVRTYVQKRLLWLEVLTSIATVLPGEVWISTMQGTGTFVSEDQNLLVIQGVAQSYNHLNTFIAALKKQELFNEVKPESVTNKDDVFQFLLNCKVRHALSDTRKG